MERAKGLNELNKLAWYRRVKVAFVLSFLVVQTVLLVLVLRGTRGERIAPISYKLIGRALKEDLPAFRSRSDEEAGRDAYRNHPQLWKGYVEKYRKRYVIDPVVRYREYTDMDRARLCGLSLLSVTLSYEAIRRAFYYVIFGTLFPRKRRRRRRKDKGLDGGEMP